MADNITGQLLDCWDCANWWHGLSSRQIRIDLAAIRGELHNLLSAEKALHTIGRPTVIVTTTDSYRFLLAAITAIQEQANLILGAPDWTAITLQHLYPSLPAPLLHFDGKWHRVTHLDGQWRWNTNAATSPHDTNPYASSPSTAAYSYPEPWIALTTGGSSGGIKLAVHTVETFSAAAFGFQEFLGGGPVNSLLTLPLHHISGWMSVWRAWCTGGQILSLQQAESTGLKNPQAWLVSLVPTQLYRALQAPHPALPYRQLRGILIGGAALAPELASLARQQRWPIIPVYGMTETAALVTALPSSEFLSGVSGYGFPLPHAKISLVEGELEIRSRSLFLGYLGDPAPRQNTWFRPRDLATFSAEGSLQIQGRADQLINSGGKKISPEIVEEILKESPLVADAGVTGLPDPEWGERVVALIKWKSAPQPEQLRNWLKSKLPSWQIPKQFLDAPLIPRTPLGKLQRPLLRETALKLSVS